MTDSKTNQRSSSGMKALVEYNAMYKLRKFIDQSKDEISGLGIVEIRGNSPVVTDVFIGPQENTGGSTDMTDIDSLLSYALEAGYAPENMRCWWHSHARMGTFFSPTDTDTIDKLGKYMGGWLLSICGNHKGEWACRLDFADPFKLMVTDMVVQEIGRPKCTCAP